MMPTALIHKPAPGKSALQLKELNNWLHVTFFSKAGFPLKQFVTQLWTPAWQDKGEHFTMLRGLCSDIAEGELMLTCGRNRDVAC